MTSEVATEPSCLVVVTNCVKTLGNVDVCVEGEAAVEEVGEKEVTVGRISLASSSTRSNSKSEFPTLPLLVITTVCQLLSMALD